MSEKTPTVEQISGAHVALAAVSEQYPDLIELKTPELQQAAETLVSEFGIRQGFFEGQNGVAHTLLLASVASNLVKLEQEGKNPIDNFQEFTMIADATAFVALNYLTGYDELVAESTQEAEGALSESGQEAVLMKYRSAELTAAIQAKIEGGMLDEVKQRLGVTDETEDDYELVVLSIAQEEDGIHHGIKIASGVDYPETEEWSVDLEAARAKLAKAEANLTINENWKKGLIKRRQDYYKEVGIRPSGSPAFVSRFNGKTYLCLTADTAELLAYDELTDQRSARYDADDHQRLRALFEHEYTHTQGFTVLENQVGISTEELRAEWFSGMKHGYQDVKIFFQDIRLLTGFSATDMLQSRTKGGRPEDIYGDIAAHIGLDKLYKIATVFPENYVAETSSTLLRDLQSATGGYEGVIAELLHEAESSGKMHEVMQRAANVVDNLKAVDPNSVENGLKHRARYSQIGTKMLQKSVR